MRAWAKSHLTTCAIRSRLICSIMGRTSGTFKNCSDILHWQPQVATQMSLPFRFYMRAGGSVPGHEELPSLIANATRP